MNSSAQSRLLAKSLRPASALLPFLLCCSVLVAHKETSILPYFLGLLLSVVGYGLVTIYNDLSDYVIDVANKRGDIPLANGLVTRGELQQLTAGLFAIGFIAALFANKEALLWLSVYLFAGWLYSGPANFKGRGSLGVLILGSCYGVMPWLLGFALIGAPLSATDLMVIAASFLFASGVVLLKDFKDLKGDALHGKKTILVLYGSAVVQKIILILTCTGYGILTLTGILSGQLIPAGGTLVLLAVNIFLLHGKAITKNSLVRKRYGNAARALFFVYAALLTIVWI